MSNTLLDKNVQERNSRTGGLPDKIKAQYLHKQLAEIIRKPIREGDFQPGSQIPTESELIDKYGVSRITVRRALQQLAAEGLIEGRKRNGTFVRSGAPFLAAHRYLLVHSQSTPLTYPFQHNILRGIQSMNRNLEFRLELLALPFREERPVEDTTASDLTESCRFEGIITLAGIMSYEEIRRLSFKHVPIVWIGTNDIAFPSGVVKVESGPTPPIDITIAHLKGIGRQKLGFIGSPPNEIHSYAKKQLISCMTRLGLNFSEERYEPSDWGIGPASKACCKLMKRCPDIDAVVALDDMQALGAFQALRSMGKKIPQEIALTGAGNFFDDGENDPDAHEITTVDLKIFEQGQMAAECLRKLIAGEPVEPVIWVEPQLIRRQTT